MSRNGSGIYSLPGTYEAVTGETITAVQHNAPLEDIAADLNAARPVVAGGTGAATEAAALKALKVGRYQTKSAGYTAVLTDLGSIFRITAAATLSLTAAATLGTGWWCFVIADGGDVIVDPSSSETINGSATLTISDGNSALISTDGSAIFAAESKPANLALYLPLSGGTVTGDITLDGADILAADNKISRPQIEDYSETVNVIGSIGGGTQDIDLELGNVVTGTVDTSTTTFTFSNPPGTGKAGSFTLILTNGGSQTVNWPASVKWSAGSAPSLTASGEDFLTFTTVDGGTNWFGFVAGEDMQ